MKRSKILRITAVAAALALCVTGCGKGGDSGKEAKTDLNQTQTQSTDNTSNQNNSGDDGTKGYEGTQSAAAAGTLSVIASPGAHTQILEQAALILADEGIQLDIESDFDDYMVPNWFVDGGVYDCNYFQHEEYLKAFNAEQDTHLVSVGKVHFEPLGIYPGVKVSLGDLAEGDVISIPRDTANQARALKLLADAQVIGLSGDANTASVESISSNPKNVKIELMDASHVPSAVATSAFVVMNGNYARQALYTVTTDALFYEQPDADIASKYANIIAVKDGNQNDPRVLRLVEVLQSDTIKNFINNTYSGAVVPYSGN